MSATIISFTIPGRIGGKGRHRSAIRGGKIATYTPAKTVVNEGIVRHYATEAFRKHRPLQGALYLGVALWQFHPKSWSAKKKAATKWITGKPDWDNVSKLLGDGMNNIAYRDDSQIAKANFERRYIEDGYTQTGEFVRVMLCELDGDE